MDVGHSNTCSLLYDKQGSGSVRWTIHSKVATLDALAAFLSINVRISFLPLNDSPTRPLEISISLESNLFASVGPDTAPIKKSPPLCFRGVRH